MTDAKICKIMHWGEESSPKIKESQYRCITIIEEEIYLGPSGVCALPLAAGIKLGIGPSEVRATSGQHLGGHYFR
jgi:hypothetical protein